jgi:hypothetical protein
LTAAQKQTLKLQGFVQQRNAAKERIDFLEKAGFKKMNAIGKAENFIKVCVCKKRRECIEHRNRAATLAIEAKYEAVALETGTFNEDKPVHVFCVSAIEHLNYLEGTPGCGFPRDSTTKIPAFKKWLVETTLDGRGKGAEQFLKAMADLEHDIKAFAEDTRSDHKMPESLRKQMEAIFAAEGSLLLKVCHIYSPSLGPLTEIQGGH